MRRAAIRFILIALALLLMPFPLLLAGALSADGSERAILLVNDVPLLALVVFAIPVVVRLARARSIGAGALLTLALTVAFALSFALQPSLHGVQVLARALGLLALTVSIAALAPRLYRAVVVIVCIEAIGQTVLALAQLRISGPLGLAALGEDQGPLYARGSALAPRGTMTREYGLLLLGLVAGALAVGQAVRARAGSMWAAVAAACSIPLGVTFSRDAVAAVALGTVAYVAHADGRRRSAALALGAFLATAAIAGALAWPGWADRVDQALTELPENAATDRRALARQALALIVERPLTGVGTGRYETAVDQRASSGNAIGPGWTPHDVPLYVAAETGVPAAIIVTALLVLVGVRAWRAGPGARLLFLAVLPFWIFDDLVLTHDQGIVLTGLWLASLDRAWTNTTSAPHEG